MKKTLTILLCCVFTANILPAQSKVFKEVNDEISTSMEAIVQDEALVGYVAFTKLEKASEDSFNYKVSIMDENLNDIGTVNFREENLELQAVSFEGDVLLLAYLKSTIVGREFKSNKAFKSAKENARNAVFTQFLNLNGKIVKQNSVPVNITAGNGNKVYSSNSKFTISTSLKHSIQLTNISQKGFACIFGDEDGSTLITYSTAGEQLWKKNVDEALGYSLLTTTDNIFLLTKKKNKLVEGGYSIAAYDVKDNSNFLNYDLKDKEDRPLKVMDFGNDQVTGKPYVTGMIINPKKGNHIETGKQIATGPYDGVYTINFNGRTKADTKEVFSYWADGSKEPNISRKGKFLDNESFVRFKTATRDFQGNTYFAGAAFTKKPKWGAIIASVILSPTVIIPIYILSVTGTQKVKMDKGMVIKQDAKGSLSFENEIPGNSTTFNKGNLPFVYYDSKSFYRVSNSNTKTNYFIMDDSKDIVIYNITKKKVVRTISHKDGKSRINIYPAKEGHIMVSEYNQKEKYTRMSIEAL